MTQNLGKTLDALQDSYLYEVKNVISENQELFATTEPTLEIEQKIAEVIQSFRAALIKAVNIKLNTNAQQHPLTDFIIQATNSLTERYSGVGSRTDPLEQTDLLVNNGDNLLLQIDYVTLVLIAIYVNKVIEAGIENSLIHFSINSLALDFLSNIILTNQTDTLQNNQLLREIVVEIVMSNFSVTTVKFKLELALTIYRDRLKAQDVDKLTKASGQEMAKGVDNAREFVTQNNLEVIKISIETYDKILVLLSKLIEQMIEYTDTNSRAMADKNITEKAFTLGLYALADITKEDFRKGLMEIINSDPELRGIFAQSTNPDEINNLCQYLYNFFNTRIYSPISDFASENTKDQTGDLYTKLIHIYIMSLVYLKWY